MVFPLWAALGLASACFSALMMLLQERLQVNGYALAFWNKVACTLVAAPFVFMNGFPHNPLFYAAIFFGSVLWAVNDVVFFSGITKAGAGAVSRLVPSATILSFLLWFAIKPAMLTEYLSKPLIAGLIFLTLCCSAFFALRLKKCEVSMQALRALWFVIFAATIGPLVAKTITSQADIAQGPYAYMFCESIIMMALWLVYLRVKNPIPASVFFGAWRKGLIIGAVAAIMVLINAFAYYAVDNPAYIPAIKATDAVIILLTYKAWGRRIEGDIWSGLGIVACAAAIIILKAQI